MLNDTNYTQSLENSIFLVIQFSLVTLTLVSNITLVVIIAFSKNLHDLSYNFIINISISDIIASIIQYTYNITAIPTVSMSTPVGAVVCRLAYGLSVVLTNTSIASLTMISIHRLKIVTCPLTFRSTIIFKHCTKFIILSWLMSAVFAIPAFLTGAYNPTTKSCDLSFRYGSIFSVVYFSATLLFIYLIPGIIMLRNYRRITICLSSQISGNTAIAHDREASINRTRSVIRVFIIATLAQTLLTLPHVVSVLTYSILNQNQFQLLFHDPKFLVILLFSFAINIASYLVNPFMFLVFDKNVKIAAHDLYLRIYDSCSNNMKSSK
ncbi:Rhodopsin, GQ-coupled [Trichoplax sp. H2]|nr:Rhodopsin, GQ-coupled [Trichoplax sp. H2]|eukprot:RDD40789.1 Rhodopsin, GQ-coupled [Trichoplax sp. H2]